MRRRNERCVQHGFVVDLASNVFCLIDNPIDGRTIDTLGFLSKFLEHLLQSLHMIFRLLQVFLEAAFQPGVRRLFHHSGRDLTIFFSA